MNNAVKKILSERINSVFSVIKQRYTYSLGTDKGFVKYLSDKLKTHRHIIAQIRSGKRLLSTSMSYELVKEFGVNLNYIFGYDEDMFSSELEKETISPFTDWYTAPEEGLNKSLEKCFHTLVGRLDDDAMVNIVQNLCVISHGGSKKNLLLLRNLEETYFWRMCYCYSSEKNHYFNLAFIEEFTIQWGIIAKLKQEE